MGYRYFVDFQHGISVFANFSYGIAVLVPPPLNDPLLIKNIFPNYSHIKYRTDLILGKAFCICIFLHFSRFGAFSIEWFAFLFLMA